MEPALPQSVKRGNDAWRRIKETLLDANWVADIGSVPETGERVLRIRRKE